MYIYLYTIKGGYLGEVAKNGANQGRLGDIEDRVLHVE